MRASANATPLRIQGGGSKSFYGRSLKGETLDTRELHGIVAYEPTELVITARAGTPLAVIEETLASHNQMLGFEPPHFDGGATKFTIQQSGRFWGANIEYLKATAEIIPGLTLVATNSPYMGYFSGYPNKSFVEGQFEGDEHDHYKYTNLPELSLAMRTEKGQVLVTGCSHSGVERIVEAAKAATSDQINLVYGGFHLIPFDREKIEAIARYMKTGLGVQRVAPAHCTGHLAFKVLKDLYAGDFLFAGLGETISF